MYRLLLVVLVVSACASGTRESTPATPAQSRTTGGVAGFDTRSYPGDAVMAAWRTASPYRWVGYYLPAPCFTGTSWVGKRAALRDAGWGIAVLFVGEQDWSAMGNARDTTSNASPNPRCTTQNLNATTARANAAAADSLARADGFAENTIIFLDVERVNELSPELQTYVRTWIGSLLELGRYRPSIYAHEQNATTLASLLAAEYAARSRSGVPGIWLAKSAGFSLARKPDEAGVPGVTIWQGIFDATETWGGSPLRIDVNVADSPNPSGG